MTVGEAILTAYRAAIASVDPRRLVRAVEWHPPPAGRVVVVAIGKASTAMAAGWLDSHHADEVIVAAPYADPTFGFRQLVGSHPYPDASSEAAGRSILERVGRLSPEDVVVALVSGGGSSLVEVPAERLTIADIAETGRRLMHAGVPIEDLNLVRRHLSLIKNGGLARAARPASVATFVISDVVDGPPAAVASGPTLADGTEPADALAIIERSGVSVPPTVLHHLRVADPPPATPPGPVTVLADHTTARQAAIDSLLDAGFEAVAGETLSGNAVTGARHECAQAAPVIRVRSGETTTVVRGAGRGGRNQAAALAAAIELDGGTAAVFAALATDGVDGPTDAAGAIVDQSTAHSVRAAGLDPVTLLGADDSYAALSAADALVRTGHSGTNVGDLWFSWRAALAGEHL